MNKIYKYELDIVAIQDVYMPVGSKILTVQLQNGKLCLWAIVNPENFSEYRIIKILGTGHEINEELIYIGTVMKDIFVWHIFETYTTGA